jgi:hypothetical protein
VQGELEQRLQAMENKLNTNMNRKFRGVESEITKNIEGTIDATLSNTSGWKVPFALLVVLVLAAALGLYRFYIQLKKIHML